MWSNVNGANIPESDWRPNHFVPLPKTGPEENQLSPVKSFTNEGEALSQSLNLKMPMMNMTLSTTIACGKLYFKSWMMITCPR